MQAASREAALRPLVFLDPSHRVTYTSPSSMPSLPQQIVIDEIRRAQHILLLTDERLDGDTLGSTLGLAHVLEDEGKKVTVFSPKPIPDHFRFIPGITTVRTDATVFVDPTVDLMIISDCSDGVYIQTFLPLMPRKVPLVMFDHHATNPAFGTYNILEPDAASTADVVWRFVKAAGYAVSPKAAQCFLTGVCTDTSLFSTSNTTVACFEAAVELTKHGAKLPEIVRNTMHSRPIPMLRVWGLLFERLHHNTEFDAVATALTLQDWEALGKPDIEASSIINFLNETLDRVDTILILRETDDGGVKGSLRSRGRDVAALAERYGGGGHKLAAGFKVMGAHLELMNGEWTIVRGPTHKRPTTHTIKTEGPVDFLASRN